MIMTSLATLAVLQFRAAAAWLVLGLRLGRLWLGLQFRLQLVPGLGLNGLLCCAAVTVNIVFVTRTPPWFVGIIAHAYFYIATTV